MKDFDKEQGRCIQVKINFKTEDGIVEARISSEPDWTLFEEIASTISKEFDCYCQKRLDGIDQRYWDLVLGEVKLILHLEQYLGITLYPATENKDLVLANQLVRAIGEYLEARSAR